MKAKKKMAALLAGVMLANLIPINLYANQQSPVLDIRVQDPGVGHVQDASYPEKIKPKVDIWWEQPKTTIPGGNTGSSPSDANGTHPLEHYQIQLTNYGKPSGASGYWNALSRSIKPGTGNMTAPIGAGYKEGFGYDWAGNLQDEATHLENGSFYSAAVYPVHFHEREIQQGGKPVTIKDPIVPNKGLINSTYFITDFDTVVAPVDQGLSVSWEYIPGADYELVYVPGEKKTEGEIRGSSLAKTISVKDDEAKRHLVKGEDGRVRVAYTLTDVTPKQIYSIFVEVEGFSKNPAPITFNRKEMTNNRTDAAGPKVVQGVPAINIEIFDAGKNKIQIVWGEIEWATIGDKLEKVEVHAREDGTPAWDHVATMYAESDMKLESIVLDEPKTSTWYRVKFVFKGSETEYIWSNEALYVPTPMRIQPSSPKIPKPYGPNIPLTEANKKDYLVSGDLRKITPDFIESTFHGIISPSTQIQLVWDAPRQPQNYKEIDYSLFYDLWVTDDVSLISGEQTIEPLMKDQQITETMQTNLITSQANEADVIGFKMLLEEYVSGDGLVKKLKSNNTYYIKIIAKKQYGNEYVPSQPTVVSISIDKNGDIFQPPVIGKPPLRVKKGSITETEVTIEWLTAWHEILTKNMALYDQLPNEQILAEVGATRVYTSEVKTTTGPMIRFEYVDESYKQHLLYKETHVEQVEQQVDKVYGAGTFDKYYYDRLMKLDKNVEYEIEVMEYKSVEDKLVAGETIEEWVYKKAGDDKTLTWETFKPKQGTTDEMDLTWTEYTVDGLKPNTKYMMMIRAYRELDDGTILKQSFPSYVIATTDTDYVGPEPTPTVPDLFLKKGSETDTSFAVYWKYNKDFTYELRYSMGDDPEKAKVIDFKISDNPDDKNYVANGTDAVVPIYGLFPETTYNVWIRAKQKVGPGLSTWSTPATGTTKPVQAPEVPKGLGAASYQSILDLAQDFKPIGKDYITVEWNKNPNDVGIQTEGNITKRYEYDLEFANNVEFLDSTVVTVKDNLEDSTVADVLAKNIVKFNKLIANKPYYVKVKARIILEDTESKKVISKESDYSKWVRINTSKSDEEYDGGENDNVVTYPDVIEESYDKGIWEWEIVDAQTVISEIVTSNDYFYTIEVIEYKDRYDAVTRRLKIPVSVIQALIGQRMELRIITNQGIYEIPASTMGYMLEGTNARDLVQIDLETKLAYDLRGIAKPYPHIVEKGEELSVTVKSKQKGIREMKRFDGMIKVALKLDHDKAYKYSTYKTYTYDYSKGDWVLESHKVDSREDATYITYSTPRTGVYTLYRMDTYVQPSDTNASMQQILATYNIPKLGTTYRAKDKVEADVYINLLLGMANGYSVIDLDTRVSESSLRQARASQIYIGDRRGYVTQEQAIHGVVRLYEMNTGYRVKPSSKTFAGVSPEYRESVSKAYALGMIEDISPKSTVTYGQLSMLLTFVLP